MIAMALKPKRTTSAGKQTSDYTLVVERFNPVHIRKTDEMSVNFTFRGDSYLQKYLADGYKFNIGIAQELHALIWHLSRKKNEFRVATLYINFTPAMPIPNFQPQMYQRTVNADGTIAVAVAPFIADKTINLLKSLGLL